MDAPFESLIKARTLAPLMMLTTGAVTIAEGASVDAGLGMACLFGLVIPTIGTTVIAWLLVRERWGSALLSLLGWAAAEAALTGIVGAVEGSGFEELLCCAAVISVVTFVLAIPAWGLGLALAMRKELDAGDTLLMWSALWFGVLNVGYGIVFSRAEGLMLPQLVVVCCALLFVVTLTRAVQRRQWYARIARGQEEGWAVRKPSREELVRLPPLFGLGRRARAVIERRHGGGITPTPYRGGVAAEPFALGPAT